MRVAADQAKEWGSSLPRVSAMTSFSVAAASAFASLGLVALAMALLARSYSRPALAAGLVGLLGLAGASTWLVQVPPKLASEAERLRKDVAAKDVDLKKTQGELADAQRRIDERANPPDPSPPADADKRCLVQLYDPSGGGASHQPAPQAAEQLCATPRAQLHQMEEELKREREKIAMLQADLDRQTKELEAQKDLARTTEANRPAPPALPTTPRYTIQPIGGASPIQRQTGGWYIIRLGVDGEPLEFSDRKFRAEAVGPKLIEAMKNAKVEIQNQLLAGSKAHRVYVRGTADPRAVVGETAKPDTEELRVVLASGDTEMRRVANPVRNEDLPQLRADWLRRVLGTELQSLSGGDAIDILYNVPAAGQGRTAEVIVYVER